MGILRMSHVVGIAATVLLIGGCGNGASESAGGTSEGSASQVEGSEQPVAGDEDCSLLVASWGGSFTAATKEELTNPFDQSSGCTTTIVDAPGEHVAQIEAQEAAGNVTWDIVDSAEGADAFYLWEKGLIEPLPSDVKAVLEENSVAGSVTDFGIQHSSISDVLVCNRSETDNCPTTPAEFFDTDKFPGPRVMINDPLTAVVWALQADGVPADQIFPVDLDRAFLKLNTIKDDVRIWATAGDQQTQALASGEVIYGTIWNGRINPTREQGVDLEVSWDGNVFRPAYNFVVKDAPNKEAAFAYLEWFAQNGEQQAKWAQRTTYGVPSKDAPLYLPEETAAVMPTNPDNLSKGVQVDLGWYLENVDELRDRWSEFLGE